MSSDEPVVHWVAGLDRPGGVVDRYLETLGLGRIDVGQRFDHGDAPLQATRNLAAFLATRPELGSGSAFICAWEPLTDWPLDEMDAALPDGATLVVYAREYVRAQLSNIRIQGVPADTRQEFDAKVGGHLSRMVRLQPVGSPVNPFSPDFPTTHRTYDSLAGFTPVVDGRQTISVDVEGVPFDLLADLKPGSRDLVVFGQSALTRSAVELPHFHRWTWLHDLEASGLVLSDPTLLLDDHLDGGWWFGTPTRDYVVEAVAVISEIVRALGLRNEDVVFYGGSLGGFSSLMMAACLPGARAVVDNPQVDLRRYALRSAADSAAAAAFGVASIDDVPPELEHRIDVVTRFADTRNVPEFLYLQNTMDGSHVSAHCADFFSRLAELMVTHPWARMNGTVRLYTAFSVNRGGHFPLGRQETVETINDFIATKQRRKSVVHLEGGLHT